MQCRFDILQYKCKKYNALYCFVAFLGKYVCQLCIGGLEARALAGCRDKVHCIALHSGCAASDRVVMLHFTRYNPE